MPARPCPRQENKEITSTRTTPEKDVQPLGWQDDAFIVPGHQSILLLLVSSRAATALKDAACLTCERGWRAVSGRAASLATRPACRSDCLTSADDLWSSSNSRSGLPAPYLQRCSN